MSKIQFEQIAEDVVEVTIPPETPMEMVQQLAKSLTARGLVEDVSNSTLSTRYFYRPVDKASTLADQLIKSLKTLAKEGDELPYWHPKMQMAHQKKMREQAIAERRGKVGMNTSTAPAPNTAAPKAPAAPAAPQPKMYDTDPKNSGTAGGTGKRYAFIKDPVTKMEKMEEHEDSCTCGKCEAVEKSNYGPRGMSQYNLADNIRRKANNTGSQTGFGANVNTKRYTSATFGNKEVQSTPAQKRPSKPKVWGPEEIAAENAKRGLKKSWADHNPIPSAEEEILKLAKATAQSGEEAAANQLANLMMGKNMLGQDAHPVVQAMMTPPPPQPTDEQMFGHLAVSEEMAKKAEQQWNGTLNNWLAEATKPISQRFASEEEEIAYWNSIKVQDSGGDHGY